MLSTSICYYAAPFGMDNHAHTGTPESPPAPMLLISLDYKWLYVSRSTRIAAQVTLVHIPNGKRSEEPLFRHLAGYTRTWTQSSHGMKVKSIPNSTRQEFSTQSLERSPGTSMATILSHMPAHMPCLAAWRRALKGMVGTHLGVLYVGIRLSACKSFIKASTSRRSRVEPIVFCIETLLYRGLCV